MSMSLKKRKFTIHTAFSKPQHVLYANVGVSLTKQSARQECDINYIINTFDRTGTLLNTNKTVAKYIDTDVVSYQDAMMLVTEANDVFEQLPSSLRARFNNDTATFLDFVNDENNHYELEKMGLISREESAAIQNKLAAEFRGTRDKEEGWDDHPTKSKAKTEAVVEKYGEYKSAKERVKEK